MLPGRSFDADAWALLTTIIELGKRLRFVLVECETEAVRSRLREKLKAHCAADGRPFCAPEAPGDELGWLLAEQHQSAAIPPAERECVQPVRFFPVPTGEAEMFTLYRLNENRDNLKRDLRGVLILAGLKDFLRRAPQDAPDLWSMREKTFEVGARDLPPMEEAAYLEKRPEAPRGIPERSYDAYLSYAHADRKTADELRAQLEKDGVRAFMEDPSGQLDKGALVESQFLVTLLSPEYVKSRWPAIEGALRASIDEEALIRRSLPLLVRPTMAPGHFRQFKPINWTNPKERERCYPALLKVLQGRGRELPPSLDAETVAEAAQVRHAPSAPRHEAPTALTRHRGHAPRWVPAAVMGLFALLVVVVAALLRR